MPVSQSPSGALMPSQVDALGIDLMARQIVLLGGAGDVGTRLTRLLLENTDAVVTSVSRRGKATASAIAATVSADENRRLHHVSHDLTGGAKLEIPPDAIVVNLTEMTPVAVVRQVVAAGGWFLETSATPQYLAAISDDLQGHVLSGGAVLCVGAAPGLTNLMAAEICAKAPKTAAIDIGLEMGMGRHYGVAGTEWFLRTAGQGYRVVIDRAMQKLKPGQVRRRFQFGENGKQRLTVGYGFAEQLLIAKRADFPLKTVRSFVALHPAWLTRSLGLMLSIGLGPAIARKARPLAKWLRRMPTLGKTRTRLMVQGFDDTGQLTGQVRVETGDQAVVTAAMIFATIQTVPKPRENSKSSVSMIDDHLGLDAALAVLRRVIPETTARAGFDQGLDRTADGQA